MKHDGLACIPILIWFVFMVFLCLVELDKNPYESARKAIIISWVSATVAFIIAVILY